MSLTVDCCGIAERPFRLDDYYDTSNWWHRRWAWQNSHVTNHIPSSLRITQPITKSNSARPARPRYSLRSLLANLHLLLCVPSFSRWPLELRFFSPDVHTAFQGVSTQALASLRSSLPIVIDFPHATSARAEVEAKSISTSIGIAEPALRGLAAVAINYVPYRKHVWKSKDIMDFEREGSCPICNEKLRHDAGIYTVCPHKGCESVSHLSCLSRHFLDSDTDKDAIVPIQGTCKDCGKITRWVDIAKDVTLRMRGEKEVTKLLKLSEHSC